MVEPIHPNPIHQFDREQEKRHAMESEYLSLLLDVKWQAEKLDGNWYDNIHKDPVKKTAWVMLDRFAVKNPAYRERVGAAKVDYLSEVWATQDQID